MSKKLRNNGMLTGIFSKVTRAAPVVSVAERAGEYRASSGSDTWDLVIAARDGRLFLSFNPALRPQTVRLTEFRPGVFVTPDGRTVHFRGGSVEFGGISFLKTN